MSRHSYAQHTCRRQVGYQVAALQRSVTKSPQNRSPKRAWVTLAPRDKRTTKTVTHAVAAVHSQARARPSRHPVSSSSAACCAWIEARASATGWAKASAVVCSKWVKLPTLKGRPQRSSSTRGVVRFDR